ncbi:MAG: S-layer homology domain-containing protein [Clostridia bacterium]|nr:S-layer homology domain-containing protein [Clostridia bacterium]
MMKRVFICILSALMLLSVLTLNISAFSYTQIATENEWHLLELINSERREAATMFISLQDAAHIRSNELLTELSHYRPDSKAWYTVLTDKSIGYDTESFEIIGANFGTPNAFFDAVMKSDMRDKLLNEGFHIGAGYTSAQGAKNGNAWCIIGVSCNGINGISLHYDDIHLIAGSNLDSADIILEADCEHTRSYMQVLPYMISGYDKDKIGAQILNVTYKGKTAEAVITNDYKDVKYGKWYYDPIMNCTEKGYYSGVGNGNFSPSGQMTREMFVTVLGRLSGIDASKFNGTSFKDIKADRWSAPYIKWAADNGIVSGYNDGSFAPTNGITRQEICSVVKRYLDKFGIAIDRVNAEKSFTDSAKIAAWAKEAVTYCQTRGIISGDAKGAFNPSKTATRAEVAVIITNLDNKIK